MVDSRQQQVEQIESNLQRGTISRSQALQQLKDVYRGDYGLEYKQIRNTLGLSKARQQIAQKKGEVPPEVRGIVTKKVRVEQEVAEGNRIDAGIIALRQKKESEELARQEEELKAREQARLNLIPPEQRASNMLRQVQIRQTFPQQTRGIPLTTDIEVEVTKPTPSYSDTITYTPYQEKIVSLLKSEENLQRNKDFFYEKTGLELTPEQEKSKLFYYPNTKVPAFIHPDTLIGLGKQIGKFPFELGSLPIYLSGRMEFIDLSLRQKEGRRELFRAFKETPKAMLEMVDPRTTEGLFNIGLSLFAIKSKAKELKLKRSSSVLEYTIEEVTSKRYSGTDVVVDMSYVDVQAKLGKKVFNVKGRATQMFEKVHGQKNVFKLSGIGEVVDLSTKNKFSIKTTGKSTKVPGGYDTSFISDISGKGYNQNLLGVTLTGELVSEPVQVFKSLTLTKELSKKPVIYAEEVTKPIRRITRTTPEEFVRTKYFEGKIDVGLFGDEYPRKALGYYRTSTKTIGINEMFYDIDIIESVKKSGKFSEFELQKQQTFAHEYTHHKTPKVLYKLEDTTGLSRITYKWLPSEIIARIGERIPFIENRLTTKSYIKSSKGFEYNLLDYDKGLSISTGITSELFVEDIFKSGRNIFRKDKFTESGKLIGRKQIIGTDRIGVRVDLLNKQFEYLRRSRDLSRTISERSYFDTTIDTPTGNQVYKKIIKQTSSRNPPLPSQDVVLVESAKNLVKQQVQAYKSTGIRQQGFLSSKSSLGLTKSFDPYKVTYQDVSYKQTPIIDKKTFGKLQSRIKPTFKTKSSSLLKTHSKLTSKPLFDTNLIVEPRILPDVDLGFKPDVKIKSRVTTSQKYKFQPLIDTPFKPVVTPVVDIPVPPPPPPPPFLSLISKGKGGKNIFKTKKRKRKYIYTPSATAEIFNIGGKKPKGLLTGFELRPKIKL